MHNLTERFAEALHRIDSDRDTGPMVELTADDAELMKLDGNHVATGKDGATTFWEDYRKVFRPFEYNGVTVIQGDDEKVSGVRTYYDSAAFLHETGGTG